MEGHMGMGAIPPGYESPYTMSPTPTGLTTIEDLINRCMDDKLAILRKELRDHMLRIERRNNLVLTWAKYGKRDEAADLENPANEALRVLAKLNLGPILLDNAFYVVSAKHTGRDCPRPIVIKLVSYLDKQKILQRRRILQEDPERVYIHEDMPKADRENEKLLRMKFQELANSNRDATMSRSIRGGEMVVWKNDEIFGKFEVQEGYIAQLTEGE